MNQGVYIFLGEVQKFLATRLKGSFLVVLFQLGTCKMS